MTVNGGGNQTANGLFVPDNVTLITVLEHSNSDVEKIKVSV